MRASQSSRQSKAETSHTLLVFTFVAGLLLAHRDAAAIELGLPARCVLGEECFLQQYPDMDATGGVADPICSGQSYDGHKGTDLRILSMKDVERGIAAIAVEDGEILRVRDGEADRLVETREDRNRISGKECGNGLVMRLGEGYEVQYCHLQQGSLEVAAGDRVSKGDKLGNIGASGFAQFPHVHITVTTNGEVIDPLTGRLLTEGCTQTPSQEASLFEEDVLRSLEPGKPQILALGVTGSPLDHAALVKNGPPPLASSDDPIFAAWGWFANLEKGDILHYQLVSGVINIIDYKTPPLERNKASYSAFSVKKISIKKGRYNLKVQIIRNNERVIFVSKDIIIN